jgi:hypothetical protein
MLQVKDILELCNGIPPAVRFLQSLLTTSSDKFSLPVITTQDYLG